MMSSGDTRTFGLGPLGGRLLEGILRKLPPLVASVAHDGERYEKEGESLERPIMHLLGSTSSAEQAAAGGRLKELWNTRASEMPAPVRAMLCLARGVHAWTGNELLEAETFFRMALRDEADDPLVLEAACSFFNAAGEYGNTIKLLRDRPGIEREPELSGLLLEALLYQGETKRLRRRLERLPSSLRDDPRVLALEGELALMEGDPEEASLAFSSALSRRKDSRRASLGLAYCRCSSLAEYGAWVKETSKESTDTLPEWGTWMPPLEPTLEAVEAILETKQLPPPPPLPPSSFRRIPLRIRRGLQTWRTSIHPLLSKLHDKTSGMRLAAFREHYERFSIPPLHPAHGVFIPPRLAERRAASMRAAEPAADDSPPQRRRLEIIRESMEVFNALGIAGGAELARQTAILEESVDSPFLLAVAGEFNSGKSSFVNFLLGRDLLPVGDTPTTAVVNVIKWAEEPCAVLVGGNGVRTPVEPAELPAFIDERLRDGSARTSGVAWVELGMPAPFLEDTMLLDTPGLNAAVVGHEESTMRHLERAEGVIWLFDALQPGKDSELETLASLDIPRKRCLGILNKCDLLSPQEVEEVLSYLKEKFADLLCDVVPTSVAPADRNAAGGRYTRESLLKLLEDTFFGRARAHKEAFILHRSGELASRMLLLMEERRAALASALERALEEAMDHERLREKLQEGEATLRVKTGELWERWKDMMEEECIGFVHSSSRFLGLVEEAALPASSLREMERYIANRYRDAAERECVELLRLTLEKVLDGVLPAAAPLGADLSSVLQEEVCRELLVTTTAMEYHVRGKLEHGLLRAAVETTWLAEKDAGRETSLRAAQNVARSVYSSESGRRFLRLMGDSLRRCVHTVLSEMDRTIGEAGASILLLSGAKQRIAAVFGDGSGGR